MILGGFLKLTGNSVLVQEDHVPSHMEQDPHLNRLKLPHNACSSTCIFQNRKYSTSPKELFFRTVHGLPNEPTTITEFSL